MARGSLGTNLEVPLVETGLDKNKFIKKLKFYFF